MQRASVIAASSGESTNESSLEVSCRDQAPHDQRKAQGAQEVTQSGNGIQSVAKSANLGARRSPSEGETEPRALFRKAGNRPAGNTHGEGKDGQNHGQPKPPMAACCRASWWGSVEDPGPAAGARKDQRRRAEIEHALHGVDRDLRTHRSLVASRPDKDAPGPPSVRKSYRRKANYLRPARKRW